MAFYNRLIDSLTRVADANDAESGKSGKSGWFSNFMRAVGEDAVSALTAGTLSLKDFSWLKQLYRWMRSDSSAEEIAKRYNIPEAQVNKELRDYEKKEYAPSWVVDLLSKRIADEYKSSGGKQQASAQGSKKAAEQTAQVIDHDALDMYYGDGQQARDENFYRLVRALEKQGVPEEMVVMILYPEGEEDEAVTEEGDKGEDTDGVVSNVEGDPTSGDEDATDEDTGKQNVEGSADPEDGEDVAPFTVGRDILKVTSPEQMSDVWNHTSLGLKSIGYGRTVLPRGVYLLSSADVNPQALEDYTFKLPISGVINWKAFSAWVSSSWSAEDAAAWEEARSKAINEEATDRWEGVDFMSKLARNPVSGDVEIDLGYLPRGNYQDLFVLNVASNNTFTLSVWSDSMSAVSVI